jgi:hypothetical protein
MTITEMQRMPLTIWTDAILMTISLLFNWLDKSHPETPKDLRKAINAINVERLDTGPTNAKKKPPEDPREEKKDAITAKKSAT